MNFSTFFLAAGRHECLVEHICRIDHVDVFQVHDGLRTSPAAIREMAGVTAGQHLFAAFQNRRDLVRFKAPPTTSVKAPLVEAPTMPPR